MNALETIETYTDALPPGAPLVAEVSKVKANGNSKLVGLFKLFRSGEDDVVTQLTKQLIARGYTGDQSVIVTLKSTKGTPSSGEIALELELPAPIPKAAPVPREPVEQRRMNPEAEPSDPLARLKQSREYLREMRELTEDECDDCHNPESKCTCTCEDCGETLPKCECEESGGIGDLVESYLGTERGLNRLDSYLDLGEELIESAVKRIRHGKVPEAPAAQQIAGNLRPKVRPS